MQVLVELGEVASGIVHRSWVIGHPRLLLSGVARHGLEVLLLRHGALDRDVGGQVQRRKAVRVKRLALGLEAKIGVLVNRGLEVERVIGQRHAWICFLSCVS